MEVIAAPEAIRRWEEILGRTAGGESFEITLQGRIVGQLIPPPQQTSSEESALKAAKELLSIKASGPPMSAEEIKAMTHEGHRY